MGLLYQSYQLRSALSEIIIIMIVKLFKLPHQLFIMQWNPDGERTIPVYAIVVHSAAEEHEGLPPGGKPNKGDGNFNSEGWVVTRRFRDFETLHVNLKEVHIVTCYVINIPLIKSV